MSTCKQLHRFVYGSLTRISDLSIHHFDVHPLVREEWATGDYIVGRYLGEKRKEVRERHKVELANGELRQLHEGELVVGSLGSRASTQEVVGDWRLIGDDNIMHDIGGSGLFGLETSCSPHYYPSPTFSYQGHVVRQGRKVCMKDFVNPNVVPRGPVQCPTVLLVGSSMSSGKTLSADVVIQLLKELGFSRVVAAKLTGSGYYHDIHLYESHAHSAKDFIDVGLPSTVLPPGEYRKHLRTLFGLLAAENPDCLVLELGASPSEPYNGYVVLQEMLQKNPVEPLFLMVCAADAYSVVGFHLMLENILRHRKADVVCGAAANTSAGRDLVYKFTNLPALDLTAQESRRVLRVMLDRHFLERGVKAKSP